MSDEIRVRFAPSPSGALHVGSARTALFNWLAARHAGGVFILRIEDTDRARSTDESIAAILAALRWLGLDWDEGPDVGGAHGPYFQSERQDLYREAAARLLAAGRAYRCFCAAEELKSRREAAMAAGERPGYDGRCGRLAVEESDRRASAGESFALRCRVPEGKTAWNDRVRGHVEFDNAELEDFIILRSDGGAAYNFAVVVDDSGMRVTDVIRGDDHISNTPRQIVVFSALGLEPPRYAHVPLILGEDGARLSKRHGAASVEEFRDLDILPDAVVNQLALLGWSLDGETTFISRDDLIRHFTVDRFNKSAAVFDLKKLEALNALHVRALPPAARRRGVLDQLEARGLWHFGDDDERLEWLDRIIEAVGDRLKTFGDIEDYAGFLFRDPIDYEPPALKKALKIADLERVLGRVAVELEAVDEFEAEQLEPVLRGLAEELGIGAGKLFTALRVAVTGRQAAPGIFDCLALLGRPLTLERIERLRQVAAREASAAETSSS